MSVRSAFEVQENVLALVNPYECGQGQQHAGLWRRDGSLPQGVCVLFVCVCVCVLCVCVFCVCVCVCVCVYAPPLYIYIYMYIYIYI